MDYELIMPQLTDTMEKGKIVKWLKKEGDFVDINEPVVEVESDKAIMEVPSFKKGVLKKILAEEGEEIPVGQTIAIIEIREKEPTIIKKEIPKKEEIKKEIEIPKIEIEKIELPIATASPSAKLIASETGIDIQKYQEEGKLPIPTHEKDIQQLIIKESFTEEALNLAKEYKLDLKEILKIYNQKIDKDLLLKYIYENNIPKIIPISSIQKSLINSLQKSVLIPIFHIYEEIDFSYINWKDSGYTFTAWFIKIFGDTMEEFEKTRAVIDGENYLIYPNANISLAVDVKGELFAPVIKNINTKTLKQIKEELEIIKEKAKSGRFSPEDLKGATFSISNLGMYDIIQFDAIIPPNHVGIVAVGKEIDNKVKLTFSFDHRIINGKEAALFVKRFREKLMDDNYIKSLSS